MSRYRRVETRVWFDDTFRSFSAPQPNAQTLWLYLLCGPRTTIFPGLIVGREEVMASDLGWRIESFRKAFGEASAKDRAKVDWTAGVVVLSRALFDSDGDPRESSKPGNPNILKSWAKEWDQVPECHLKDLYIEDLKSFSEALGEPFTKAFREALGKAYSKACRNQDQYQKQDQEQDQESIGAGAPPPPTKGSRKRAETPLDPDWAPRPEEFAQAMAMGLDCGAEAEHFCDHHTAKGSTFADWNAAFRTWLKNAVKFGRGRAQQTGIDAVLDIANGRKP